MKNREDFFYLTTSIVLFIGLLLCFVGLHLKSGWMVFCTCLVSIILLIAAHYLSTRKPKDKSKIETENETGCICNSGTSGWCQEHHTDNL